MAGANYTSLEPFLNRKVLFVHGFPSGAAMPDVKDMLKKICPPHMGRVDVLTHPDGTTRGTAFLNYHSVEDATAALNQFRFGLFFRDSDVPLKLFFSSDRVHKDLVQGPPAAKFKVLVKNIPDDVDVETLFNEFSKYGEIIQCHLDWDAYGQPFFICQYVTIAAVQLACQRANRLRLGSSILVVEPFAKRPAGSSAPGPSSAPQYAAPAPASPRAAAASAAQPPIPGYFTNGSSSSVAAPVPLRPQQPAQSAAAHMAYPVPMPVHLASAAGMSSAGGVPAFRIATAAPPSPSPRDPHQQGHGHEHAPASAASGQGGPSSSSSSSGHPLLDLYGQRAAAGQQQQQQKGPGSGGLSGPLFAGFTAHLPAQQQAPQQQAQQQQQQQQYGEAPTSSSPAPAAAAAPGGRGSMRGAMLSVLARVDELGELLCCPITQECLVDPVVCADGHTYERAAIEAWLMSRDTSPMTNEVLPHKMLIPNNLARTLAEEFL